MSAFGVPITAETVGALPRYSGKQEITQEDCARVAMSWIHAEDKNLKALEHALDLKKQYGTGGSVMVLVYNATGDTLDLVDQKDWDGSGVYHERPPASFKNGQWISFLHVSTFSSEEGARVYRGRNTEGEVCDYMVAWSVPWTDRPNYAYTEVRGKDHFKGSWDYIKERRLRAVGKVVRDETNKYCASTISIGGYTSAECIAVLRHKYKPLPENE